MLLILSYIFLYLKKISEIYEPNTDFKDNLFITKSLDSTSHFEEASKDILNLYQQINGKELDLTILPEEE